MSTTTDAAGVDVTQRGFPVSQLQPNGVFITFLGVFLGSRTPTSHNRVLDGHLATLEPHSTPGTRQCPPGATGVMQMSVFLPRLETIPAGSGTTIVMTACYAGPDSARIIREINAMVASVSFSA